MLYSSKDFKCTGFYPVVENEIPAVNYIDDIAAVAKWSVAYQSFQFILDMLQSLGIWEAEPKRCPPDVIMEFLGVGINSIQLRIFLTDARMLEIRAETKRWLNKKMASRKDIQQLVGKLSFAASTVRSGRLFFSRILNFLRTLPKHGIRPVPMETKKDIAWWHNFVQFYNGVSMIQELQWRKVDSVISTDACLTGLGGFAEGEYFHCEVPEKFHSKEISINELECLAVMIAVKVWAAKLSGKKVLLHCDNESTVSVLNSGKAKHPLTQACLREVMFLAGLHSFSINVEFKPWSY